MSEQHKLTDVIYLRVRCGLKKAFKNKAQRFGDSADVHRELLEAFVDDRVTIVPDPNKPQKENLYES
jgi:hypothetical protein